MSAVSPPRETYWNIRCDVGVCLARLDRSPTITPLKSTGWTSTAFEHYCPDHSKSRHG